MIKSSLFGLSYSTLKEILVVTTTEVVVAAAVPYLAHGHGIACVTSL
jgi:hypothetical protein